jgi:tetratricopeptide (TPR) repeat protein
MNRKTWLVAWIIIMWLSPLFLHAQEGDPGVPVPGNLKAVEYDFSFLEAQRMKATGNIPEARDFLLKCILLNPASDAAYFEMANLHVVLDDLNAALSFAQKARSLNPGNVWYRYLLGRLYFRMGRVGETIKEFESICKDFSVSEDVKLELAGYYIQAGKWKKALAQFDRLESECGVKEDYCIARERIYLTTGKGKKAIREIEKLIEAFPNESRFYGMLAEAYTDNGLNDKALEVYQKLFSLDPENGMARISFAAFYMKTGRPDLSFQELKLGFASPEVPIEVKASFLDPYLMGKEGEMQNELLYQLLNILVETHPESILVHGLMADFLINSQRIEDAAETLQFILSLDKSNYFVWEKLLLLKSQMEDIAGVYQLSKEALELFPVQPLIYLFHGSSSFQLRKLDESLQSLEAGYDLAAGNIPVQVEFLRYLGECHYRKGNFNQSDAFFEQLISLDSTAADVMNNYAYYLSLRGQKLEKALELAGKAMEMDPGNVSYMDTFAWVLFKKGELDQAAFQLEKALKASGNRNPVILEHYGDVMFKKGDPTLALDYWHQAREAGSGSDTLEKKIREKKYFD